MSVTITSTWSENSRECPRVNQTDNAMFSPARGRPGSSPQAGLEKFKTSRWRIFGKE